MRRRGFVGLLIGAGSVLAVDPSRLLTHKKGDLTFGWPAEGRSVQMSADYLEEICEWARKNQIAPLEFRDGGRVYMWLPTADGKTAPKLLGAKDGKIVYEGTEAIMKLKEIRLDVVISERA
jgi:hypothetical protein